MRFFDNEGRVVAVRAHRRIEERESIPVRLSHVLMNTPTPEKTVRWYVEHLGFRLSDTMRIGDREIMWFLRCNSFHHSFGFVRDLEDLRILAYTALDRVLNEDCGMSAGWVEQDDAMAWRTEPYSAGPALAGAAPSA
ncbi:VOC family protein [Nonomuraea sp. NPDC059007]|uniref:VOC family protein n=1 Tax=Nonomuraea sp. NPDC059007 TaxID=3346692 RepID=UPI0036A67913